MNPQGISRDRSRPVPTVGAEPFRQNKENTEKVLKLRRIPWVI